MLAGECAIQAAQPKGKMNELESGANDAAREARLRRKARRAGLYMQKSRRDGTYQLVHNETGLCVLEDGTHRGFGCTLDEVEHYLGDG